MRREGGIKEMPSVAAVRGGRGVEIHAEGGEGHRRRRCGLGAGREVRAGERKLHAGGQRAREPRRQSGEKFRSIGGILGRRPMMGA